MNLTPLGASTPAASMTATVEVAGAGADGDADAAARLVAAAEGLGDVDRAGLVVAAEAAAAGHAHADAAVDLWLVVGGVVAVRPRVAGDFGVAQASAGVAVVDAWRVARWRGGDAVCGARAGRGGGSGCRGVVRSEEHTSELQSPVHL